jgi:hypothetical protein
MDDAYLGGARSGESCGIAARSVSNLSVAYRALRGLRELSKWRAEKYACDVVLGLLDVQLRKYGMQLVSERPTAMG